MAKLKYLFLPFDKQTVKSTIFRRILNSCYLLFLVTLVAYISVRITFSYIACTYDLPILLNEEEVNLTDKEFESIYKNSYKGDPSIDPFIFSEYGEAWRIRQHLFKLIRQPRSKSIPMRLVENSHDYPENSLQAHFLEIALADRLLEEYTRQEIFLHYIAQQ